MPRTWTDQPDEMRHLPLLYTIILRDEIAEVRAAAIGPAATSRDVWYLTIGNLFRSETVACPTADDVLDVLARITARHAGTPIDLPQGVRLIPNARRRDDD